MQLELKRLRFSKEADNWLRVMKSRADVTPNLLCRIGFCLSLEEPGRPEAEKYPEDSDREINRYTLLGEYEAAFVSLLRQRLSRDEATVKTLDDDFRAHMNRGVILLSGRLKTLSDLGTLATASTVTRVKESAPKPAAKKRPGAKQ